MIDIEKIRSFYYVIKEGSLIKAAKALDKNHTTLSKHLTDLEQSHNTKLFVRVRKRLELTEKGEELFTLAQKTIPNLENGANEILTSSPSKSKAANHLRVLTTTGIIGVWVVRTMKKLQIEFPDLRASIITTNADIDFEGSKAELGILPKQSSPDLTMRRLRTIHAPLFASQDYIDRYGAPKTLDDLKNHKLISFYSDYEGNIGNVDWHLKEGMPNHEIRKSSLTVNSGFLLFEAACQGLGIVTMAKEFEYIKDSNLVNVLPQHRGLPVDLYFITRADTILTPPQKRFLELLSRPDE